MLKCVDTLIGFSEVPDEISLCINISGCLNKCEGCHSPYLREDIGVILDTKELEKIIKEKAKELISCLCILGGDHDILALRELFKFTKHNFPHLKTCLYTGRDDKEVFDNTNNNNLILHLEYWLDFLKTGPYIKDLGDLTKETTNQRMYKKHCHVDNHQNITFNWEDITYKFWKQYDKERNK